MTFIYQYRGYTFENKLSPPQSFIVMHIFFPCHISVYNKQSSRADRESLSAAPFSGVSTCSSAPLWALVMPLRWAVTGLHRRFCSCPSRVSIMPSYQHIYQRRVSGDRWLHCALSLESHLMSHAMPKSSLSLLSFAFVKSGPLLKCFHLLPWFHGMRTTAS